MNAVIRVDLCHAGLRVEGQMLAGRLLARLLGALLQASLAGQATRSAPCSRVALRERIVGLAELHRTQVWRALRKLDGSVLRGLIGLQGCSSGPFWLDEHIVAQCVFTLAGQALDGPRLAQFLGQQDALPAAPAAARMPSLGYVAALAQADFLLDRGELYPARTALGEAATHVDPSDAQALAALSLRRARVARRLGEWAVLQDELRELATTLNHGRLSPPVRQQLAARMQVLAAWHLYGSLGNAAAALARLNEVDPGSMAVDLALRSDYSNLRGIVLRELALARADAQLAAQALASLGEAVRHAAIAGMADPLQIATANYANCLAQLQEAGLVHGLAAADAREAVRWLLLSESICARWQLGASSLLNTVFLLRLAQASDMAWSEVALLARAQGHCLGASGFAALAAQRWAACQRVHSQIPVDQRCAFFLMWAHHAGRENDRVTALACCKQVLHQCRKLRDPSARARYDEAVARLRSQLLGAAGKVCAQQV